MIAAAAAARPRLWTLAPWLAATLAIGWVGGAVTRPEIQTWYAGLVRPSFAPPNWVFGPVWTALYVAMAVAAWLVWRTPPAPARRTALALFALQLALNLLWSFLFFAWHRIDLALIEVIALGLSVAATAIAFARVVPAAGWLMAPYVAWVTYAAVLNGAFWRLNP
jgi:tryptophan-rich sensory protein